MRVGRFKAVVSLQKNIATGKDDFGQKVEDWVELFSRRGDFLPLDGKEYFAAGAENSEITAKIITRYDLSYSTVEGQEAVRFSDINNTWRAVVSGVIYDIKGAINVDNASRYLVLMCSTGD